jgi:hypothetical protein
MFNVSLARRFRKPLSCVLGAVRRVERFLGPDDDWVEDDRRWLFETLDGLAGHSFTMEKSARDYITTAHATPDAAEQALHAAGYQRNLASTRKYRTHHGRGSATRGDSGPKRGSAPRGGGKQWAVGSWVLDPADTDWQHHVFLFPAPDGGTDVYGHKEATVRDPVDHVTDGVIPGDPHDHARDALDAAGVGYGQRNL